MEVENPSHIKLDKNNLLQITREHIHEALHLRLEQRGQQLTPEQQNELDVFLRDLRVFTKKSESAKYLSETYEFGSVGRTLFLMYMLGTEGHFNPPTDTASADIGIFAKNQARTERALKHETHHAVDHLMYSLKLLSPIERNEYEILIEKNTTNNMRMSLCMAISIETLVAQSFLLATHNKEISNLLLAVLIPAYIGYISSLIQYYRLPNEAQAHRSE